MKNVRNIAVAKITQGWVVASFVLFFSACGQQRQKQAVPSLVVSEHRIVTQAPSNNADAGVVVSLDRSHPETGLAEMQKLVDNSESAIRVVNADAGLYEVFGLSVSSIQAAVPSAQVESNRMLGKAPIARVSHVQAEKALAMAASPGVASTPECIWDDPSVSLPVIESESHPTLPEKPEVLVKGEEISLAAQQHVFPDEVSVSARGVKTTRSTRYAWIVNAPRTSKNKDLTVPGTALQMKLDELGGYTVFLLSRDSKGRCAANNLMVGATYTKAEALKKSSPASLTVAIKKLFAHLSPISAWEAQGISKGAGVKIAIIDSGLAYNHTNINGNLVLNAGELAGKNFVHAGELPQDDNGHGSHVAGLSAGLLGGIAPEAQILPIKAMNALGMGDLASIAGAIEYAADEGAQIINLSLGMEAETAPKAMVDAVNYARRKGALIVTAAGNFGSDNDQVPNYPANLSAAGVITVGAVDSKGTLTDYSNFGVDSVDIAAPGGVEKAELVSLDYLEPESGSYAKMSGTSMASPVVAGLAALILSANPELSAAHIKNIIIDSGVESPSLNGKIRSGKHIDVLAAVEMAKALIKPATAAILPIAKR